MIKIKNDKVRDKIVDFLIDLKIKQEEFSDTEEVCYPLVSLYLALKKNLFFKSFLLHPIILMTAPFYRNKKKVEESELEQLLLELIEFELTEKNVFLSSEEFKKVIKVHKSLKAKREKNETVSEI
jgi:hypothetical protein